jgi:putative ABC transport system permease protein
MKRFSCLWLLAAKSAWNRRYTLSLIIFSVALSAALLLGLERIRTEARDNFAQAISGTDLVVGARGAAIPLILYAVFHLGAATNNMGYDSALAIASMPEVEWVVPLSMGDTHRGYPVVATDISFFQRYRYRRGQGVEIARGQEFQDVFQAVLGSQVAQALGYSLGDSIVLAHGSGQNAPKHSDKPFSVTGILSPTGTPVDRSIYINLESMEAIHIDWRGGAPLKGFKIDAAEARKRDLRPKAITALLVGLKNRRQVFSMQRKIQEKEGEPLSAVMPGVALDQLWQITDGGEKALMAASLLVTVTGLCGLVSTILAGLGQRRRELAILRSLGARPLDLASLLVLEGFIICAIGAILGALAVLSSVALLGPKLLDIYGLALTLSPPTARELIIFAAIIIAGAIASLIPALRAYRLSLSDGLSPSI